MSAYLMTKVSQDSTVAPLAGITSSFADDDTLKFRRDQASVHYTVRLLHEWITDAEFTALVDFVASDGYGPHTFTFRGYDYTGTLTNEPARLAQRGELYSAESVFIATRT